MSTMSLGGGANQIKDGVEPDIYEPADALLADYFGNTFANQPTFIMEEFRKRNNIPNIEWVFDSYKQGFTMQDLEKVQHAYPVRTVEDTYLSQESNQYYMADEMRPIIKKYPKKVARINALAMIVNGCQDVVTFKRAYNEMLRIIFGKKKWNTGYRFFFDGDDNNPDILNVEAAVDALPRRTEQRERTTNGGTQSSE